MCATCSLAWAWRPVQYKWFRVCAAGRAAQGATKYGSKQHEQALVDSSAEYWHLHARHPGAGDAGVPRRAARDRTDAAVVAITGSVGKTGTKEAMRLALGALGPTHATAGNLNNHIGVPLTLARMPRDTEFAVIEMGAGKPGDIDWLQKMVRP